MQISSTQAHVSSSLQETSPKLENKNAESVNDPPEIWDQKKKKPAIFAKMLEGLNAKLKKETSVSVVEETGKNVSKLSNKNKTNSSKVSENEISESEIFENRFFGFFKTYGLLGFKITFFKILLYQHLIFLLSFYRKFLSFLG